MDPRNSPYRPRVEFVIDCTDMPYAEPFRTLVRTYCHEATGYYNVPFKFLAVCRPEVTQEQVDATLVNSAMATTQQMREAIEYLIHREVGRTEVWLIPA